MYCVRNILYYICIVILFISCSIEEEGLVKRAPSPDAPSSQLAITSSRNASDTYIGKAFGIFVCNSDTVYKGFDNEPFIVLDSIVSNKEQTVDTLFLKSTNKKQILFPSNKEEKLDFYGYFPYKDSITFATPYYKIINWATEGVDLLIAKELDKNSTSPKVNLTFKHMFSKIVFNVVADPENSTLTNLDLNGMKAKVSNMNFETQCNVITSQISFVKSEEGEPIPVNDPISFAVQPNGDNGQRAECIVCPTILPENETPLERIVTFTLPNYNNKVYIWTIPEDKVFLAGKSYVWNLRLKGDKLEEVELVGVFNDWEDDNQGILELGK